jgi:flagellar biosynthesis protein FlhB
MENRPLAQEMYKNVEVGDIIPEDLFYAVSLIYAELYTRASSTRQQCNKEKRKRLWLKTEWIAFN